MTKGKITSSTSQWLALPCVFLQPGSLIEKCTYCDENFTFWSSRKHCEFCGCVVHNRCTVKVRTPEGKRAKMCQRCHTYKMDHCQHLSEGDEFICYNGRLPAAAHLCLSEEKQCLLLTLDPSDNEEEILLRDIVSIQKGFSHAGHMRAGAQYDPLRCFSITTKNSKGWKCYDMKSHSGLHCQQWVTALNSALFVYKRLQDQEEAIANYEAQGHIIPERGFLYFPEKTSKVVSSSSPSPTTKRAKTNEDDSLVIVSSIEKLLEPEVEIVEESDMVVVEVSDCSRDTTPCSDHGELSRYSPVVRKSHYKIRTGIAPHRPVLTTSHTADRLALTIPSQPDWRTQTTGSIHSSHGLPYKGKKSPLACSCSCHIYALEPARTLLFPIHQSPDTYSPYHSSCEQCRGKCPIFRAF